MTLFPVLHEDADLLVLHKPAGLVCHPTKGDAWSSLISRVRIHLGLAAEPQMVHRLDRETSGVMVFGKTPEASEELRRLWQTGLVTKEYVAIVHGAVREESGHIDGPLGKDEASAVSVKDRVRPDGVPARTYWWRVRRFTRCGTKEDQVDQGRGKQLLRRTMADLLPSELQERLGYCHPTQLVIEGMNRELPRIKALLASPLVVELGLVPARRITRVIRALEQGDDNHLTLLERILSVEVWLLRASSTPVQNPQRQKLIHERVEVGP